MAPVTSMKAEAQRNKKCIWQYISPEDRSPFDGLLPAVRLDAQRSPPPTLPPGLAAMIKATAPGLGRTRSSCTIGICSNWPTRQTGSSVCIGRLAILVVDDPGPLTVETAGVRV